ncbi:hypothetical protein KAU43_09415 [candidate division WOR-3 bacterium]|nr:hypothetical protein [candidate division WOR-3 bacterium]
MKSMQGVIMLSIIIFSQSTVQGLDVGDIIDSLAIYKKKSNSISQEVEMELHTRSGISIKKFLYYAKYDKMIRIDQIYPIECIKIYNKGNIHITDDNGITVKRAEDYLIRQMRIDAYSLLNYYPEDINKCYKVYIVDNKSDFIKIKMIPKEELDKIEFISMEIDKSNWQLKREQISRCNSEVNVSIYYNNINEIECMDMKTDYLSDEIIRLVIKYSNISREQIDDSMFTF